MHGVCLPHELIDEAFSRSRVSQGTRKVRHGLLVLAGEMSVAFSRRGRLAMRQIMEFAPIRAAPPLRIWGFAPIRAAPPLRIWGFALIRRLAMR